MKIETKLVQSVRINPERAEKLRALVFSIWKKTGYQLRESDIVNFLIDEGLERIEIENKELKLK